MASQSSTLGRQTLSPTKTPQPIADTCDSPEAALWGIRSVPVVLVAAPSLVGPLELEAGLCLAGMGALVELAPGIGCCAGCQHLHRVMDLTGMDLSCVHHAGQLTQRPGRG